ncbi:hypothetical protein CR513_03901, partial [Mucuna pruriens]
MRKIPYASTVGSLMYAQICTQFDIAFVHWKTVKCVMRYLKRIKGYMLIYWKSEGLEIIGMLRQQVLHIWIHLHVGWRSYLLENLWLALRHSTRVQNKQIFIKHIGTSFMLDDPLTKGLIPKK